MVLDARGGPLFPTASEGSFRRDMELDAASQRLDRARGNLFARGKGGLDCSNSGVLSWLGGPE